MTAGDTGASATNHTDFGSVNVGSGLVRTFTISNTGTAAHLAVFESLFNTLAAMQREGYTVAEARDGVQALDQVDRLAPDVVILDLNLPGMSGEEWIAWYVQQGKRTPVVVASGKGDILTITKGNNMTAALTKPFHMEELQELIDRLTSEPVQD